MDNIVERLRSHLSVFRSYPKQTGADDMAGVVQSIEVAADEIERLQRLVGDMLHAQHKQERTNVLQEAEIEKLRVFAKEVIRGSWESNLDGGDIQEMAEKHGLLQPEIYNLDKHGDHEDAVPGEDTIYVFTDWMKD